MTYQSEIHIFDQNSLLDIYPIQYGYAKCPSGHRYGPTSSLNYLFHFIVKGEGKVWEIQTQNVVEVKAGQGFFNTQNRLYSYVADESNPWEYYWLEVNGLKANRYFEQAGLNAQNLLYDAHSVERSEALEKSFEKLMLTSKNNEAKILSLVYHIFSLLIESASHEHHRKLYRMKDHYVQLAVRFVELNHQKSFTIQELAHYVGIDAQYLAKIFKEILRVSPTEFITDFRISKGKRLLTDTNLTIREIAEQCGYQSQFYFSTVFKKITGMSPINYRKNVMMEKG